MKILYTIFLFSLLLLPGILYSQNDQINGPSQGVLNSNSTFYYQSSHANEFSNPQWSVIKGVVTSSSVSTDKSRVTVSVRWTATGTGTVILTNDGDGFGSKDVNIVCVGPPTVSPQTVCSGQPSTIKGSLGSNGSTLRWYNSDGTILLQTGLSLSLNITTNTSYQASSVSSTGCESSKVSTIVTVVSSPSVPNVSNNMNACAGKDVTLTATPGASDDAIRWYNVSTGGTVLFYGNSYSIGKLNYSTTYYVEAIKTATSCTSVTRYPLTVNVSQPPALPSAIADQIIIGSGSLAVTGTPNGADQIRWFTNITDTSPLYTGLTFTSPTLSASKTYYLASYNSSTGCESRRAALNITVSPKVIPTQVTQEVIRTAGVVSNVMANALTPDKINKQVQHLDGLGRPYQIIAAASSGAGTTRSDVVQLVEYDALGRNNKQYLPYVATTVNGSLQPSPSSAQANFYTATGDYIANDAAPFALTKFEDSPLGRPIESGNVGAAFQPGTTHTQQVKYTMNAVNEVRQFKTNGASSLFYGANTINKSEVTDPNGARVQVFTNPTGQTLLKKVELSDSISNTVVSWLETYYIYDEFGRIKYMVSPKGVAALQATGWDFNQALKDQYVYEFHYDLRGRLIEKKIPGQAWIYLGYDDLNRLVLMQDGMLRNTNKWLFVKYDQKGRAVMQGFYKNAVNTTRTAIQSSILDGLYNAGNATYGVNAWYENRGNVLENYTNNSFPKTNQDGSALDILSVSYYDDHDFDNNGTPDYTYAAQSPSGFIEGIPARPYGMSTGSKRRILNTSTWLYTYAFYDKYGRVIQIRSDNHLSATKEDLVTNIYDFEGKLLWSKKYHKAGASLITTILNRYLYDDKGRLLTVYQTNNAMAEQKVVAYVYNALGQLIDKKLHETTANSNTFMQSVDYRYTIGGQLLSINNAKLISDSGDTNDDANDYFGMEFLYNTVEAGLNNMAQYDGAISAVKWKGFGTTSGVSDQRSYKYDYDKSGKLKKATSQVNDGSTWAKEVNSLNEKIMYDHNGNIQTLKRNQRKYQFSGNTASYTYEQADNLTYTYNTTVGDQLTKVEDAASVIGGFSNGTSGTGTDFTYDNAGNVLSDKNKGMDSVYYNDLGKVRRVKFADGRVITYGYDARGSKLTMKLYQGATLQTTTDYVNGFVYENANLSFFCSPEGRVVQNGANLEYQYSLSDNQGNTRIVFTSATPAAVAKTANFESAVNADFQNYPSSPGRSGTFEVFDHTDGPAPSGTATYSQLLNGGNGYQVGVAKNYHVFPGDKVKIDAYAKYQNVTSNSSNLTGFATAITSAFGVNAMSTGEALKAYNTLNSYGAAAAGGTAHGNNSNSPKGFVTILLFDKNFNLLDAAWDQLDAIYSQPPTGPKELFDHLAREVTVKEEGYAYAYISNESPTFVDIYFDDVTMTYTPGNIIQHNEYYPFGLQANTSWTRDNVKGNNYLYNEGNELNQNTGWYEMFYRGYDPVIGRMMQVDPYAVQYSSLSSYHYSGNNPVMMNDPSGGYMPVNRHPIVLPTMDISGSFTDGTSRQGSGQKPNMSFIGGVGFSVGIGPDVWSDAQAVNNGTMSLDDYLAKYGSKPTEDDVQQVKDFFPNLNLQQDNGGDWGVQTLSVFASADGTPLIRGKFVKFQEAQQRYQLQWVTNWAGQNNIIASTAEAKQFYETGDGSPRLADQNTSTMVVNSPEFQRVINRLVSGKANRITSSFDVDMTSKVFHIGDTNVDYETTIIGSNAYTKFTLFVRDGFWDPNVVAEALGVVPDGMGPNLETKGSHPYAYVPVVLIMQFPNPGTYGK